MSKELPTNFFSFTEIGGVGEMIYRAARFPAYATMDEETGETDIIIPVFTPGHPPKAGNDYSITGQELLASLCNLYKEINKPDYSANITECVWAWCMDNIYPYNIDDVCETIETMDFSRDVDVFDRLQRETTFPVKRFVEDVCKLGTVYEYYDALMKVKRDRNVAAGRELYYEGRICDSLPFLEFYRQYEDDTEYLKRISEDYDSLMDKLIDMFPDMRMRLKRNKDTGKIEYGADVLSVFDICWFAFARMVADVAPPADTDPDYMYSSGSILTCMACGRYFVRHSSRQRYCNNPNCQDERNRRKSRAYYKRKK